MSLQQIRARFAHYRLIGECMLELLRARWTLVHRPFHKTAQRLQRPLTTAESAIAPEHFIRRVRGAMGAIERRIAWKPTCLMRAIAGHRVLARRMIASKLVVSVTPASGKTVDAHAWLEAGGLVVTGRSEKAKYMPIYAFTNTASKAGQEIPGERARSCSL